MNVDLLRDEDGNQILKRGQYEKLVYNEYADDGEGTLQWKNVKWRGRPYVFKREAFIDEEAQEYDIDRVEAEKEGESDVVPF